MLYRYFFEIKSRILLIIISWIITILICYCYKEILLFLLVKLNVKLYSLNSFYFISTNLIDVFSVYLQLSYFISTQFSIAILFYHLLIFISPALFKHEYKILKLIIITSFLFFFFSVLMLNTFILPYVWAFFSGFQTSQNSESINIFFEAQITEYFNFYITMYYINVSIGQVFVFILLLMNFIDNKIKFVSNTRKVFYSIFLILATIITPPDIISQIIISLCFSFIYELIIIIILLKTIILNNEKNTTKNNYNWIKIYF